MFARFDKMAKAFTRIGKDIAIAVKQGGPLPENNPKLRLAIQNAKGANMPKDRVEAAIKRASSKEEKDYTEVTYEGVILADWIRSHQEILGPSPEHRSICDNSG